MASEIGKTFIRVVFTISLAFAFTCSVLSKN